jgi:hypothetical protein
MAKFMKVSCCVQLVTSTARWLRDDDGNDDNSQIGPIVIFINLWLFNNILCSKANSINVDSLLICFIKYPAKVCLVI